MPRRQEPLPEKESCSSSATYVSSVHMTAGDRHILELRPTGAEARCRTLAVHVILPLTTRRSVTQRVCSILGTDVDMEKASGRLLDHIAVAALELRCRRAAEPLNALRSQCAVTAVVLLTSSRC